MINAASSSRIAALRPLFSHFRSTDHGEMMEMQGFGGSPSSWQQAEVTSQESLCQSCSTAGSNVAARYPAGCTCIHSSSDIHT